MRKIIIDPDICNGLPTLEGTRITAQTILEFLSAGDAIKNIRNTSAVCNDRHFQA